MATLSALAWSALLVGGGYALGAEFDRLLAFLARYGRIVTAVTVLLALAVGVRRTHRRSAERNGEDPPRGHAGRPGG